MKPKRMTVPQAHKMLGTKTTQELANTLGASRQNVEYWIERGLPSWWAFAVRAKRRQRA